MHEFSFGLLILAHLMGDFVLQNDYMATHKTHSHPVCALHVLVYTAACLLVIHVSGYAWPLWAYAAVALTHYPVDRWRLAAVWMDYTGQSGFKRSLSPWSVIAVDNTYHLACAWVIWVCVKDNVV